MPYLNLPVPVLNSTDSTNRGIVDPDEVMANFNAIAQLINGNLGAENIQSVSNKIRHRDTLSCAFFTIDTTTSWTADGVLSVPPMSGYVRAISVHNASSTFSAQFKSAGVTIATVTDAQGRGSYMFYDITTPAFGSGDTWKLNVTAGSCQGIGVWYETATVS